MFGGMFAAGAASPWQMQYAAPDWKQRLTRLSPQQEAQFMAWAQQNRAPITDDYDMRGFWLNGGQGAGVNPNDGMMHYPDTYKTPLHESFSGESMYANPKARPPMWNDRDQLVTPDGRILFDERRRRK
jgi:hypothetical protein